MQQKSDIKVFSIFLTFIMVGLTSFGPSMVIEAKKRVVERLGWLTEKEFLEGLALAQLIPGATYVSTSIYVGYKLRRLPGAAASFLGFVTAPFALMVVLSWLYFRYQNIEFVDILFKGLGAVVIALIVNAVWGMAKMTANTFKTILIAVIAFGISIIYNNVFLILLISAALGFFLLHKRKEASDAAPGVQAAVKICSKDLCWRDIAVVGALIALLLGLTLLGGRLFSLSITLFKIGALVFGNGFTMLPLIQQEVVTVHHWLDLKDFMVGVALGQMTPGPVAITSTFIGYSFNGIVGAIVATLSIFAPSFFLIVTLFGIYSKIKQIRWVNAALSGLLASFVGLMVLILINMGKYALVDVYTAGLAVLATVALLGFKLDTKWVIAGGTALYLAFHYITGL